MPNYAERYFSLRAAWVREKKALTWIKCVDFLKIRRPNLQLNRHHQVDFNRLLVELVKSDEVVTIFEIDSLHEVGKF